MEDESIEDSLFQFFMAYKEELKVMRNARVLLRKIKDELSILLQDGYEKR